MVNSEDVPGGLSGGARGSATGNPAVIESVTTIPYTRIGANTGATNSTNEWNEIVYDEEAVFEGVRVEVLPFIGTESITLTVSAQVNSLVGFSKTTAVPLIAERNVNSVLNVQNGVPVVIGGLDKTTEIESTTGIPLLKDIPVLKYLFSVESTQTEKSKVLVVITPTLKNSASGDNVAARLAMGE
jgi:general secretion pathway protein D